MERAQKLRWFVLLLALAMTLSASLAPTDEVASETGYQVAPPQSGKAPKDTTVNITADRVAWLATDTDPFLPRIWLQPEPTAVEVAKPPLVAQVQEPAPIVPLPYQFVGQMVSGGERILYLSRGDQVLLVRAGDILDGEYKVKSVDAKRIEFEAIASGLRQELLVPVQED